MAMNQNYIPDKINRFNVYLGTAAEANRLIGITDEITLPNFSAISDTLTAAGMAGKVDSPAVGMFEATNMEIGFTNISVQSLRMAAHENEALIMRAAQEVVNPETGEKTMINRTITVRGWVAGINYGALKMGSYGNGAVTKNITYYKDVVDGETITEVDYLNGRAIIGGEDLTAGIQDLI